MSHDYSSQSVEEDPRMMAFFDSLVQRELEYWSSDEDLSSNEMELYDNILQATRNSQLQQGEGGHEGNSLNRDGHTSDSSTTSEFSPFTLAFASVMAAQDTNSTMSRVLDAHDESERLSTAQTLLEPGRGRSAMRTNRKRISEIIAQNRKEVMRAAELRQRSLQSPEDLHASILSSSSSDSDSDDQGSSPRTRTGLDIGHVLNKRSAQQQRAAYQLKRLHALRTRLVTSDTDNSSDESPHHQKRARLGSNSSRDDVLTENGFVDGGIHLSTNHCTNAENSSNSSGVNNQHQSINGKTGFNNEAGACLHSDVASEMPNGSSASIASNCHSEPSASTSGTCVTRQFFSSDDSNSVNGGCLVDSIVPNSAEDSSHINGSHGNTDLTHDGRGHSDGESSQPVWTEFKRFRKRLERARRYYRKKNNNHGDSSDDD